MVEDTVDTGDHPDDKGDVNVESAVKLMEDKGVHVDIAEKDIDTSKVNKGSQKNVWKKIKGYMKAPGSQLGTYILSITTIVLGSIYFDDCPHASRIPVVMLINGCLCLFSCIIDTIKRRIKSYDEDSEAIWKFDLFLLLWAIPYVASFITWMVFVYGSDYPTFEDINDTKYCNKTLFLYAFWLPSTVLLILIMMCSCCICYVTILCSSK